MYVNNVNSLKENSLSFYNYNFVVIVHLGSALTALGVSSSVESVFLMCEGDYGSAGWRPTRPYHERAGPAHSCPFTSEGGCFSEQASSYPMKWIFTFTV